MLSEKDIAIDYFERIAENIEYYKMGRLRAVTEAKNATLDSIMQVESDVLKARKILTKSIENWRYKL